MNTERVDRAVSRGLDFLLACQEDDGSFVSYSSATRYPFRPATTYMTAFGPMLMLNALAVVESADAQTIRKRLATWLLSQKSPDWSYNYWDRATLAGARLSYPDDLDSTCCALIALHHYDSTLVDGDALGHVVKLLLATETQVGGPYKTWLVDENADPNWHDVDLAVNCNVAGFLRLVADPLPSLNALMEQAVATDTYRSPYYPTAYPVIYYMARAYPGPLRPKLARSLVRRQRESWWGSPLSTALAVSSLVQLGELGPCLSAVKRLLATQQADGSWSAEAFWIDPIIQGKKRYGGSAALTTALVLESLMRHQQALLTNTPSRARPVNNTEATRLRKRIITAIQTELEGLNPALKKPAIHALEHTFGHNESNEIILLPHLFNASLHRPQLASSDAELHLGAANLYGWLAYTIYDDFLDDEGRPLLLSVANIAHRYSLKHFELALPKDTAYRNLVLATFDRIDGANAWELAYCRMLVSSTNITIGRLPHFSNTLGLADRSLGHTLPPLGVLAAAGIDLSGRAAISVQDALRHYLAARQLNDDLHDWEQDLRAGVITYVVAQILQAMKLPAGRYRFSHLLPKMRHQFWHHTLPDVCQTILGHTAQARQAARSSELLLDANIVQQLADKIETIVQHTSAEQTKAETFLAAYSTKTIPTARTQSSPKSRSAPRQSNRRPT